MKFKDWKRNLREQEFNIPDIYEKIKPYAYQKRVRSEPVLVRPLVKRKMLFAPLYILLLLFSFIIFSPTNKQRDSLLVGDQHVSYFTGIEEIETYLQENKGENPTYKSGLQVESQSIRNSGVAMPEFPMSGSTNTLTKQRRSKSGTTISTWSRPHFSKPSTLKTENWNFCIPKP